MKKVFVLAAFAFTLSMTSCGSASEKKQDDGNTPVADTSKGVSAAVGDSTSKDQAAVYICPCGGCPEVREAKEGKCPKCEMDLVVEKK